MNNNNKFILVTGGAGYIGTNIVKKLLFKNEKVVVIDNFSNSFPCHIEKLKKLYPNLLTIYNVDICDKKQVIHIFKNHEFKVVIHLAGKKYIPESFEKPNLYYINNIVGTQILLDVMTQFHVEKIIFSSSITVYGDAVSPVDEKTLLNPLSPYAKTKADGEELIKKWAIDNNFFAIVLRLSNPIGAENKFMLGDHSKKGNFGLLPYLIDSCIKNSQITLNGGDHNTKDGTTIRDYVHVMDVANAFVLAIYFNAERFEIFNIGSGQNGYSVLDVIHCLEKVSNKILNYNFGPKRLGDVSCFVTNNKKALSILKLKIKYNLEKMVKSQYKFTLFNQKTK